MSEKRKRGRPKLEVKREERLLIQVTPEEKALIKSMAQITSAGTVSALVREALLGATLGAAVYEVKSERPG